MTSLWSRLLAFVLIALACRDGVRATAPKFRAKIVGSRVARRPRLARRGRSEERGPARTMVAPTAARRQADPRAGDLPGGAPRLSRRGLVLARLRRSGQSPPPRPLSAPLLDGRLSGRRVAERRPRRSPRRRRRTVRRGRHRGDKTRRHEPAGGPRAQSNRSTDRRHGASDWFPAETSSIASRSATITTSAASSIRSSCS